MRINSKEELFGQPVLAIRKVVRFAMQERFFGRTKASLVTQVAEILHQSETVARYIIKQLIQEEYLVLQKIKYVNTYQYELTETEKGRRFGIATADPAITRAKADMLLKELLDRAKAINQNKYLVYYVERLKVFGSYLSDKETLGDLDVFAKLSRKKAGDDFMEMRNKRISLALKAGRQFSNYTEQICWPHREVMLMLKTKKKGLSLHDEDIDEIVDKTVSKVIYEFKPGN